LVYIFIPAAELAILFYLFFFLLSLIYIFVPAGELATLLRYFLLDDHEEENYHQNIGELAIRQKTYCDFPTR